MRTSNKTNKWNPSMTEVHNQGHLPHNPYIPKNLYIQWRNTDSQRRMLAKTRDDLADLWHGTMAFDANSFDKMLKVSGTCVPTVYYRKISASEWTAINGKPDPFKPVFDYLNTDLYRYWMSSSLLKVMAFGNENATDDSAIIIKLTFSTGLASDLGALLKPHQETGVQGNRLVVALHREGFAQIGNITSNAQVTEIKNRNLDHNLGFTSQQLNYLKAQLVKFEKIKG